MQCHSSLPNSWHLCVLYQRDVREKETVSDGASSLSAHNDVWQRGNATCEDKEVQLKW